jgi:hypothetical protein
MVATSFPCQPRWGATMALAGASLWGRAALLPSCYFVSRTVDYTNYGSMSVMAISTTIRIKCSQLNIFLLRIAGSSTTKPVRDSSKKGRPTMLILIIILILVFGLGGGYYGHTRWGPGGGAGIGLGTILLILLIAYMLGLFR